MFYYILPRRTSRGRWTRRSEIYCSSSKVNNIICYSLLFKTNISRHSSFERKNNDLHTNLTITLQDALNGFNISFPHLDGHQVTINREKITWPGARIKKKGEGLPQHDQNNIVGDLYVTIDVDFPKSELNDEQRESKFCLY